MTFITIISLAFITFTTRYLFLEGRLPLRLGLNVKQILSFSAPAVLTAIFVPILLMQKQELNIEEKIEVATNDAEITSEENFEENTVPEEKKDQDEKEYTSDSVFAKLNELKKED